MRDLAMLLRSTATESVDLFYLAVQLERLL
jgi:hypothetical protein